MVLHSGLGLWCGTGGKGYGVVQGMMVMVFYRGLVLGLWCCTGG